jgi:hypothetical protein
MKEECPTGTNQKDEETLPSSKDTAAHYPIAQFVNKYRQLNHPIQNALALLHWRRSPQYGFRSIIEGDMWYYGGGWTSQCPDGSRFSPPAFTDATLHLHNVTRSLYPREE